MTASKNNKNRHLLFLAFSIVFLMVALSYASVPLYRLFCQVTGYGGTTQTAEFAPTKVLNRDMEVRFNGTVNRSLSWEFHPQQASLTMKIGQVGLAYFTAKNTSDTPLVGTATYNVTPNKAGEYFNKIQCFCFTKQVLKSGEVAEMPVQFYIDPKIADDPNLDDVKTITLSYTFFKANSQELAKKLENTAKPAN